jgi:hypothetical protein
MSLESQQVMTASYYLPDSAISNDDGAVLEGPSTFRSHALTSAFGRGRSRYVHDSNVLFE